MSAARDNGLAALPSQTNFVFVNVKGDANLFRDKMQAKSIYIRGAYQGLPSWSRVSMGRIDDVARYISTLPEALNG